MADGLGFTGELTCAMQCSSLDAGIAWYAEHLGFELMYRADEMGWCEMTTPVEKTTVGLSEVEKPEVRGGATLTFGVEDVGSARGTLEDQGVRFDGETIELPGLARLATFFDPDGNKMMLVQSLGGPG